MMDLLDRGKVAIIQNTLQAHQNYLKIPVVQRRVAISSKAKYRKKEYLVSFTEWSLYLSFLPASVCFSE